MYVSSQQLKFEGESVLLEVPPEGIQHWGWKITPLAHPEVTDTDICFSESTHWLMADVYGLEKHLLSR